MFDIKNYTSNDNITPYCSSCDWICKGCAGSCTLNCAETCLLGCTGGCLYKCIASCTMDCANKCSNGPGYTSSNVSF